MGDGKPARSDSLTTLELNSEDSAELRFILASYLSDLRMAIADTDRSDFRDMLNKREAFIKAILTKLPEQGGSA